MRVVGIDYSTRAIDIVAIDAHDGSMPIWRRYALHGDGAVERTRMVGEVFPSRLGQIVWHDVDEVALEHPGGGSGLNSGVGHMLRVQGAVLAMLPKSLKVRTIAVPTWKSRNGIPGNSKKPRVAERSIELGGDPEWEQDAHDAHLIARALVELRREEAIRVA